MMQMKFLKVFFGCLFAFLMISCQPPTSSPENSAIVATESPVFELIRRNHAFPNDNGTAYVEPVILIGAAPENLPFQLTLPEGTKIVGSIVNQAHDHDHEEVGGRIFLTVPRVASVLLEGWAAELTEQGYRAPMIGSVAGTFFRPPETPNRDGLRFCHDDLSVNLHIDTFMPSDRVTDVRINVEVLENIQSGPCGFFDPMGMEPPAALITLESPSGVAHRSEGRSGGANSFTANLEAKTALSAAELIAHYNQQLTGLGWTALSQGAADIAAWSRWEGQDDQGNSWVVNLLVLEKPALVEYKTVTLEGTRLR